MRRGETRIEVVRRAGQRYDSRLHRADGVTVALQGGSYNRIGGPHQRVGGGPGRVPHDIAHFVVEDAYGLPRGLWGVLAAGGIVQNATFVAGRLPPHAQRRAAQLTDAVGEDLRQAEVLVRVAADLALTGRQPTADDVRAACGERWFPPGLSTAAVRRAQATLHEHAAAWDALVPGEALTLVWRGDVPGHGR